MSDVLTVEDLRKAVEVLSANNTPTGPTGEYVLYSEMFHLSSLLELADASYALHTTAWGSSRWSFAATHSGSVARSQRQLMCSFAR